MGFLLDTNIALIGLAAPERISAPVRRAAERGPVYLSVVSYWEVLQKSMRGKLDVGDPRVWWTETLDRLGATPLLLRPNHVSEIYNLKALHQDPFDRALISQAVAEDLTLLTTDSVVANYKPERVRLIS